MKKENIPNILTLGRILFIPIFVLLLSVGQSPVLHKTAAIIFALYQWFGLSFQFEKSLQSAFMLVFFASVGLSADFSRLKQVNANAPEAIIKGTTRAMNLAMNREVESLESRVPFLATVASVSPYIGLFGTVWGIMHAFMALSGAKQATLQMVAPGIAEALIATAIGLFAAIPAVMAYNRLSLRVNAIEQNYGNFIDEFTTILHRQAFGKAPH